MIYVDILFYKYNYINLIYSFNAYIYIKRTSFELLYL